MLEGFVLQAVTSTVKMERTSVVVLVTAAGICVEKTYHQQVVFKVFLVLQTGNTIQFLVTIWLSVHMVS